MYRRTSFVTTIIICLAGMVSGGDAYELCVTDEGTPIRWPEPEVSIPYLIERPLGDTGEQEERIAAIQSAFQSWEQIATGSVSFRFAGVVEDTGRENNTNVVMWKQEEWPYDSRYVARTRLHYDTRTGFILRAEIMLNAKDYHWSTNGESGTLDVQNAATHEIGHFLGFDDVHSPEESMFEFIVAGETSKRYLSDGDIAAVEMRYPRIADGAHLTIQRFKVDVAGREARMIEEEPVERGNAPFVVLVPFPAGRAGNGGAGVVRAKEGNVTLTVRDKTGGSFSSPLLFSELPTPGRIRAVSTVGIDSDALPEGIVLLLSTPGGLSVSFGALAGSGAPVVMSQPVPVAGVDDVVAFSQLGTRHPTTRSLFAFAERDPAGNFTISISLVMPSFEGKAGGVIPERLLTWSLDECVSLAGLSAIEGDDGESSLVALVENEEGAWECRLYEPLRALRRGDSIDAEKEIARIPVSGTIDGRYLSAVAISPHANEDTFTIALLSVLAVGADDSITMNCK